MSSHSNPKVKDKPPVDHAEIVRWYLEYDDYRNDGYLEFYRGMDSLKEAVRRSSLGEYKGKRFSHQRRIPRRVLEKLESRTRGVNFRRCKSFDSILSLIYIATDGIRGIGELTIYDTADRIGAYMNLRPEHVYIHSGVRAGVRALGLDHRAEKLEMSEFPAPFRKLRPDQLEDCLCIYKDELAGVARKRKRSGC